ncbi:CopD family protein [Kiloniella sp. b19]|uniref:CopD family protein n=1 Tax=Kiloniella sp. GXU_MW_B19 TaxID=3141326 RepID=UPI0031DC5C2E
MVLDGELLPLILLKTLLYAFVLAGAGQGLLAMFFQESTPALRRFAAPTALCGGLVTTGFFLALWHWSGGFADDLAFARDIALILLGSDQGYQLVLFLIGFAALGIWRLPASVRIVFSVTGLGLGTVLTGHSGSFGNFYMMKLAHGLHVLAAAFWFSALVPMLVLTGKRQAGSFPEDFGQRAPAFLVALVLSGGFLAFGIVQSLANLLILEGYGGWFLLKLFLAAGLLLLGVLNRFVLVPLGAPFRLLRISMKLELLLMVGIFLSLSVMTIAEPPLWHREA